MHAPPSENPDLLPCVRACVLERGMLAVGDGVVVGVSGGPDSVALLDLLFRLRDEFRLSLHVAHLNHRLRGEASDRDAEGVAGVAVGLGLPFHAGAVDVEALARREGRSLEDAARIARQAFLDGVRRQTGATRIALGHTRGDQAETLLLRLVRGAGATGLAAIRPVRDGIWVRPLLDVSRKQVETYLRLRGLSACRDRSNDDLRFQRNRVRKELLPHLATAYNPRIEEALARTAEILQQEDDFLDFQAEEALQKSLCHRGERKIVLDAGAVFSYHISIQRRMLRKALFYLKVSSNFMDFQAVQDILSLRVRPPGSVQVGPEARAHRSDRWIVLSRSTPPFEVSVQVPGCTEVPLLHAAVEACVQPAARSGQSDRRPGPWQAWFDLSELCGRLFLRNPRPGDRFQPYGMSGGRKVSDLLIDLKIPRPLRDEVPLLLCGDTILWVVGLRTAGLAPVTGHTREVLEVTYHGGWICSAQGPTASKG